MLILGRKTKGVIQIGDNIRIVIVQTYRDMDWVRIGIDAPPDVKILREELEPLVTHAPAAYSFSEMQRNK